MVARSRPGCAPALTCPSAQPIADSTWEPPEPPSSGPRLADRRLALPASEAPSAPPAGPAVNFGPASRTVSGPVAARAPAPETRTSPPADAGPPVALRPAGTSTATGSARAVPARASWEAGKRGAPQRASRRPGLPSLGLARILHHRFRPAPPDSRPTTPTPPLSRPPPRSVLPPGAGPGAARTEAPVTAAAQAMQHARSASVRREAGRAGPVPESE